MPFLSSEAGSLAPHPRQVSRLIDVVHHSTLGSRLIDCVYHSTLGGGGDRGIEGHDDAPRSGLPSSLLETIPLKDAMVKPRIGGALA